MRSGRLTLAFQAARAQLLAFDVAPPASLGGPLSIGERILLALLRVSAFAEDETHRRAEQLEKLSGEVF
ncbi:hypothetical protein BXO559_20405, partial [Xanthomonas oryzae pv. oryzae]